MKIHEFQAKTLLKGFDLPTPRGGAAESAKQAREIAESLGDPPYVVKAQIHAGGRGKGRFKEAPDLGGVKVVKSVAEATEIAGLLRLHIDTPESASNASANAKLPSDVETRALERIARDPLRAAVELTETS